MIKHVRIGSVEFFTPVLALTGYETTTQKVAMSTQSHPIIRMDDAYQQVILQKPAPSNAEISLGLGFQPQVVGSDASAIGYPAPYQQTPNGIKNIGPSFPSRIVKKIVAAQPNLAITSTSALHIDTLTPFDRPGRALQPTPRLLLMRLEKWGHRFHRPLPVKP